MLLIEIVNDKTGTDQSANYTVRVVSTRTVSTGQPFGLETLALGHVTGHNRADGWRKLVRDVADLLTIRTLERQSEPHIVGTDPPTSENDPSGRFRK